MQKYIFTAIIVAVITGSIGFLAGDYYRKSKTPSNFRGQRQFANGQGQRPSTGNSTGRAGMQPVAGEITAVDDQTLTIKTQNGDSKIVVYSDSTKINKTETASKDDLSTGSEVMVLGNQDDNGTITAQTISLGGGFMQARPAQN